jgi:hypothetical protein
MPKTAKTKKRKKPGPKPKPPSEKLDMEEVRKLGALGLTDTEIGEWFGLSERTINRYKKDPAFMSVLKKGKMEADANVKRALYKRAIGYDHPDVHISSYEGKITITPITKHYAPDPLSMIFWLKNREPDKWRDKHEHDVDKETKSALLQLMDTIRGGE